MSTLTEAEINKLSVMYDGDKNRDAASKIRGFLFQDYVMVKCLLQNHVECVCSEYLEDVDVFFEDGKFEFIQVKYYPKTSPNMKEILTDLYYQYLRLKMLQSTLEAAPRLYIHRKSNTMNPTLDDMKKYINLGNTLAKSVSYPDIACSVNWLKTDVYSINKKEEQKKKLFFKMASEDSLKEFIEKFEVIPQVDIEQYKRELMEELARVYPNPNKYGNEEHWQSTLLGLAILYIQERYRLANPVFDQLRVNKKEFDCYMLEFTKTKTEQTIVAYLAGIACEEYGEIIKNNELSYLQIRMLNLIYQNTIKWINKIGKNVKGQCQLLNTFSIDDVSKIASYKEETIDARLYYMAECKPFFICFIDYLLKIILNICQEKIKNDTEISKHPELFDVSYYMVMSVTDYVCLSFPEDKYVSCSIILPPVGQKFKGVKRKIVERMINMSSRPGKWFFENSKIIRGKNYYDYSTADVSENPTVADLGENSFYIECMDCIGVDDDEWSVQDDCRNCIFSEKCVNEGEKL